MADAVLTERDLVHAPSVSVEYQNVHSWPTAAERGRP